MKKGLPNPAITGMFCASLLVCGIALGATTAAVGSSNNFNVPPPQNVTTVTYTNTGTYTETLSIPMGVCAITVQCYGAGGGGGGISATGAAGGGGGGGFSQSVVYVTPNSNYTFTINVGAHGTEGGSGGNGGNGGQTSFNTNVIVANGGGGGGGASNGGSGTGGAGAVAGIGAITYTGGSGGTADYSSYSGGGGGAAGCNGNGFSASGQTAGYGNGGYAGNGVNGDTGTHSGGSGMVYGGGGSGGISSSGNAMGGTGAIGAVVVSYNEPITVSAYQTNPANCHVCINGTAVASANGGTPSYSYVWNDVRSTSGATLTALPGTYTVTASDVNGCTATASVTIITLLWQLDATVDSLRAVVGQQQQAIDSLRGWETWVESIQQCVDELCNGHSANYHSDANQNLSNNNPLPAAVVQNLTLSLSRQPMLYQNNPNPFTTGTKINYYLPEGTVGATIVFYDMYGNQIQSAELSQTGNGVINIASDNLSAGIYSYSLMVNNQVIDTKRMIFQK